MAKTVTFKPEEEFARSYADRLILSQLTQIEAAIKLSELADRLSSAGIGLSAVRSLLASNPDKFVFHERRWVPTARLEGQGRPFAEAARLLLERYGAPMAIEEVALELSRARSESFESLVEMLGAYLKTKPEFVVSPKNNIALAEWSFVATDESLERALALNGLTAEEVEAGEKALAKINFREPGAVAAALKAAAPISMKVLGAVAWKQLSPQDPRAILLYNTAKILGEAIDAEGFVFGADGMMYPEAEAKKWVSAALKVADKIAPTIEVEDIAPIDVKSDDVAKMIKKIVASDATVTATKLLEEFYEITPSNKTFPDDLGNLVDALKVEKSIWWVGEDRFRKPESAPDFIYSIPEPFHFTGTDVLNEEGDLVDVELTDDGLSSSLRKLLQHPLATDVLDEEPGLQPKSSGNETRLVLKSIHRELGTFPMSQFPQGWISSMPNVQELIFIDPNGRELQVWANNQARLLFNLIDWWYEQVVESGSVFKLVKTGKPNVFEFTWDEQTDPLLYISSQRMETLRQIQAESEGKSTLDVLIEVMAQWPKGADFLTLLAEVNVVRRTSRRLLASLLSSYQCFYQRSGSPVWHFDNKKVELGFDKTKKKFIKKD